MDAQQQPLFPFDPDSVGKQTWDLVVMFARVVATDVHWCCCHFTSIVTWDLMVMFARVVVNDVHWCCCHFTSIVVA